MSDLTFRAATGGDLHSIVAMLSDDELAENREKPVGGEGVGEEYVKAFAAMESEHYNNMLLAESDGKIVGCLQLVFVPGLSRRGAKRAIIESVRVASDMRGQNVGTAIMKDISEKNGNSTAPVENMWCAHTVIDNPEIAIVANTRPL